jgi:leucyl aminopeptidase
VSLAPEPGELHAPSVEVVTTGDPVSGFPEADAVAVEVRLQDGDVLPMVPVSELGLDPEAWSWIDGLLHGREFAARAGEVVEVPWPDQDGRRTLLLMGLGGGTPAELRRAGAAVARRVRGREQLVATWGSVDDSSAQAFVEGVVLGGFSYRMRTGAPGPAPVRSVVVCGDAEQAAAARGVRVAQAGWFSRALALTPSNIKSPTWLVERALEVAERRGLTAERRDVEALDREGFGGLLGVGRASPHQPALVSLEYTPASASRRGPHVVLVGKGITFDTGGLSLKPAEAMVNMKRDMTGAGVVLAVMDALGELGCPVRVTGLVAVAENCLGGDALRPGDVIRHYGGRTTEVTNTDAEGRLVLADAMAYAVDQLAPSVLVDVATLTGAVRVALGQRTGGLFTDDDELADELLAAGKDAGEPLWRLPLAREYDELLESKVADADNAAGSPGAITAALFLRHFAGDVRWAHLDLASVGDSPDDSFEWTKGATGFGARLLLGWLCPPEGRRQPDR